MILRILRLSRASRCALGIGACLRFSLPLHPPLTRQLNKVSRISTDNIPWVVFGAGGASKVGTFYVLIDNSPLVLVHNGYHFVRRPIIQSIYGMKNFLKILFLFI